MSAPEIDREKLNDGGIETAEIFILKAAESLEALLKCYPEEMAAIRKHPILGSAMAFMALLDARLEEHLILQDDTLLQLTDLERSVIYRALEADLLFGDHRPASIEEMDAALARFKKIAGL